MKQVLSTSNGVVVADVPPPRVEPGGVLVLVDHTCVSAGTELSGVRTAETPLWRRALRDRSKVRAAVAIVKEQGLGELRRRVQAQSDVGSPMGYSASGTVLEVGEGVIDLRPGDRVACAGAGVANHAEVISVPRNLVVRVPDGVTLRDASVVTLGAIALQGVRRAAPTLGETFVVVGLGVIGQLTVQLLEANGCRTIVSDLDRRRVELALSLGADASLTPGVDPVDEVSRLTDGIGADSVIITAATPSSEVVSLAFQVCRKKARVVLVGDVGLDLRREDFYAKELDFLISTSYGPGRYDRRFEEEGLDYPIGYVRWTENRNMGEILRLIEEGRLQIGPFSPEVVPMDRAGDAYAALTRTENRPLLVLLQAKGREDAATTTKLVVTSAPRAHTGDVRFAVVGPGSFARGVHLPNIVRQEGAELRAIVGRSGHAAAGVAKQFAAAYSTTELDDVLSDPDVDAVLVSTRHDDHATVSLRALEAGKHVLVEKPLAISRDQLHEVEKWFAARDASPVLLTGFNRRFSPFAQKLHRATARRSSPLVANYRMNAGYLPPDHWVHGPEGGGRNIGEACHIYDLFTFLAAAAVRDVTAVPAAPTTHHYLAQDNFVATVAFDDGSVATLTYTALGSSKYPKEQLTLYADGVVWALDDYRALRGVGGPGDVDESGPADKGHAEELAAFVSGVRTGEWPIPLWQQVQAMQIAFDVEDSLVARSPQTGES